VFELKWIYNLDIQNQEQTTCIGYNFTIFYYITRLRNVRQMYQMTEVSGEGMKYLFHLAIILFSSVLL
jgi:hypothetical protein